MNKMLTRFAALFGVYSILFNGVMAGLAADKFGMTDGRTISITLTGVVLATMIGLVIKD